LKAFWFLFGFFWLMSSPVSFLKTVEFYSVASVESDFFGVGDQPRVDVTQVALAIGFLGNLKVVLI
jgi:hypothetical protein